MIIFSEHISGFTFFPVSSNPVGMNQIEASSSFPVMRAECPVLMLAFLPLALPQAASAYPERTEGHVCASPRVRVSLTDSLSSHPSSELLKARLS